MELTFSDEVHLTDSLSREAVEMARRLRQVRSLGDALDARWMAVWGPDGLEERAALAGEILMVAQEHGDRDLELMGRAQRVATSLESGDVLAAESDIAQYARLTDELRMPIHQWAATTMRATRALLHGALDDAEQLAEEAFAFQPERPNARWARAMELSIVRWEQGRLDELREIWQSTVERFPRLAIARAWLALADLERGDHEAARRAVWLLAERMPEQPRSGLWLPGLALTALVAAHFDDADAASRLYPVLLPYADRVVSMNMEHPVICFGSSAFYLGLLAAATSRWAEAVDHFEAAIGIHGRLGADPLLARTRYEYARMLLRRGQAADWGHARELLDRAAATVRTLGMVELGGRIGRLLEAAPEEAPPAAQSVAPIAEPDTPSVAMAPEPRRDRPGQERFQREGEFWTIAYDDAVVRLKDSKGLRQIALLLGQPGRELHATDLEAMVSGPAEPAATRPGSRSDRGELELRADGGDAGELLDAEARAAYKARLDDLQEEIDEADEFNDPIRAEKARDEREFLIRELARAVGLGGRDRKAASHAERARLNATRAIRSAMTNLTREHPSLGRYLAATIRTGRYCSYTPDPRTPVAWQL